MHLNAFYDLQKHTYSDALIQPVHQKDKFGAFCEMVDRHDLLNNAASRFLLVNRIKLYNPTRVLYLYDTSK